MSDDVILLEVDGAVATVTLNRPQAMNALNRVLRKRLAEVMRAVDADDDVRAVILTGAGERAFTAGLDLKELGSEEGALGSANATDPADIQTLNRLGAEWDEGTRFVPYTPPPPKYTLVWRRFPVKDLPERRLFRDMEPFMTADWGKAVEVAIQAIQDGGKIPAAAPPSVADPVTAVLVALVSAICTR